MSKRPTPKKMGRIKLWAWIIGTLLTANFTYHLYRNPIHFLSFFSRPMAKTPEETWRSYSDIFLKYGDLKVTPELLAAIAQVESAGNPLAAPDWDFSFSTDVTQIFAPASTAFGLMQITRGTFDQIMSQCDGGLCPRQGLATRARATDSVKLAAVNIRKTISNLLSDGQWERLDSKRSTSLAAVIHLCGAEVGRRLVQQGYRVDRLPRCGTHWPDVYVKKVWDARKNFERISRSVSAGNDS